MKTENYVKELFFIIFRQKRVIGWTIIITLAIALLITLFWPPIYSATGNILVRGMKTEKSPQAIEKEMVRSPIVGRETLASEERILNSSTVIEQTLNKMMADNLIPTVTGQDLVAEVYRIQGNLKTELVPASNVIEISYFDNDRDMALTLLSALMENYIQYRNRIYNPVDDQEYFAENAERYRQMLSAKEDELLALVHKTNVSDPVSEMASNFQVKQNLQLRLQQLQNESISYFGLIQHLDGLLAASIKKQQSWDIIDANKVRENSNVIKAIFNSYQLLEESPEKLIFELSLNRQANYELVPVPDPPLRLALDLKQTIGKPFNHSIGRGNVRSVRGSMNNDSTFRIVFDLDKLDHYHVDSDNNKIIITLSQSPIGDEKTSLNPEQPGSTTETVSNPGPEVSPERTDPIKTFPRRAMPLFSFIENVPAIVELNKQVQELLMERGTAMRAYNPESVKVKLLSRHLDEVYERLHSEVRNYRDNEKTKLLGILKKTDNLEQQISEIDRKNVMLQEQIITQRKIERDIAVYLSSFDVFSMRREESMAGLDDQLPSQVSVVKKAFPSMGAVFPKPVLMLILGLLLGVLMGLTLGFLREYFDHTFKKPSEVERYTGMQVIASISYR